MLHHCISSVLCCKPNTHFMQGPNNDYTHAYSHPMSNLLSCQSPFWSLSVFLFINFPNLHAHLIASSKSVANYMNFLQIEVPWPKNSTKNSMHSIYSKIKPFIYLFRASFALDLSTSILVFAWSIVSYHHCNTLQLYDPICHSCGTSH